MFHSGAASGRQPESPPPPARCRSGGNVCDLQCDENRPKTTVRSASGQARARPALWGSGQAPGQVLRCGGRPGRRDRPAAAASCTRPGTTGPAVPARRDRPSHPARPADRAHPSHPELHPGRAPRPGPRRRMPPAGRPSQAGPWLRAYQAPRRFRLYPERPDRPSHPGAAPVPRPARGGYPRRVWGPAPPAFSPRS